ncbi:MAG TPA: hypothetical protein VGF99_11390 [Myxococcota bacterium]
MVGIRKLDAHKIQRPLVGEQPITQQTPTTTPATTSTPATAPTTSKPVTPVKDTTTTAPLGQSADASVNHSVAAAVVGEQASTNALDKQSAVHASHAGRAVAKNELTPEFKLAKQLGGEYAQKIWHDKAPPELQAMASAVGPQLSSLATQTATSVMSDPTAMANLGSVVGKLGKEGFTSALTSSTKEVGEHFLKSAGVQAKNPEAIKAALSGIETLAPKIGGSVGTKLAGTAKDLAPRLLGEGAEAATKAAASTAATGAKAASAGAKALPVIGNIVAVGSTMLAGANLISQLTKKPRDVEKILKEGVNTLTQGIGVAFPWVALGGTLTDAAWSAKIGVSDQKKAAAGITVTDNANVAASLPLLTDSAEILQSALRGAGKTDAADKVGNLVTTTKAMGRLDLGNPGDRMMLLRKDQQEALVSLAHESRTELDVAAHEEGIGPRKEALSRLANGFGALADTTLATMRLDKREGMPGFGGDDDAGKKARADLETKRNELAGTLVKQLSDLGLAELARRTAASTSATAEASSAG